MTRAYLLPSVSAGLLAFSLVAIPWTGCKPTGVGDPCIPEQEYIQNFAGFTYDEVSTESESFQCETRLCFVNHFQGRVSCPYGQTATGAPPVNGADSCYIPHSQPPGSGQLPAGSSSAIIPADPTTGNAVQPQCTSRRPSDAVFCSCRCMNVDKQTNDGANYCSCPSGFSCDGYVSSIGPGNGDSQLTGYYCIKNGSEPKPQSDCTSGNLCDAKTDNCAPDNQYQFAGNGQF